MSAGTGQRGRADSRTSGNLTVRHSDGGEGVEVGQQTPRTNSAGRVGADTQSSGRPPHPGTLPQRPTAAWTAATESPAGHAMLTPL
jgi:hypothetical protein